ncbi:hypothetical protein DICSQDRAFT_166705 [Dichomitus squalens LYAD-421 SS1]|uniref:uncharacterized protein n=1 Tax=Dichomitus squalens (strain LYAD-421) TaxID=732165 RepID=UPI00044161AF|nr:uncharacterized protein DICSQDRAFT_166705 [Dichomitus squalens LYAD-421 SS1]EJF64545.1 hypothetical protein DICSQDRAFT_166705 [Dichomitus squalens LYAD-421 SS1]
MGIHFAYRSAPSLLIVVYHSQLRRLGFDACHPGQQRPSSLFTLTSHLLSVVRKPMRVERPECTRDEYLTAFTAVTTYAPPPTVVQRRRVVSGLLPRDGPDLSPMRDRTPGDVKVGSVQRRQTAFPWRTLSPQFEMRASRFELALPHPMPG